MRSLMRILLSAFSFTALLAACAPAPPPAPLALDLPSQPTSTSAPPTPTDEPLNTAVPAIADIKGRSQLVVVSSATGRIFNAYTPLPLGENYNYAFSPDGHTLAVANGGKLDLVDLRSWTDQAVDVDLHGWISAVVFSPDGSLLALASGSPEGDMRIVDPASGEVKAAAQAGFSVRNVHFTADRQAVMVYGPHVSADELSLGAPLAGLFSVSGLARLWSVELKGIRAGAFPKDPQATDIHQPGAAWYYAPAIAFAPDADKMYVVHGDADRLTTIDFHARTAKTVAVEARLTLLDRLLALTAGVAYAKGMDGTVKQAALSSDGSTLYVVSRTESYSKSSTNMWDVKITHGGLQLIRLPEAVVLHQVSSDADSVMLSPDGRSVFLTGWQDTGSGGAWSEVADAASGKILKHLDGIQLMPTLHLDGRPALVSIDYLNGRACRLASLDPVAVEVHTAWNGACLSWLTKP